MSKAKGLQKLDAFERKVSLWKMFARDLKYFVTNTIYIIFMMLHLDHDYSARTNDFFSKALNESLSYGRSDIPI